MYVCVCVCAGQLVLLSAYNKFTCVSHTPPLTAWHFAEKRGSQVKLGDVQKEKSAGVADEKFARTGNQLLVPQSPLTMCWLTLLRTTSGLRAVANGFGG